MRNFIFSLFIACLVLETSSCGTIFRPERKGQKDGKVDLEIALLDAIGLLFFIIPGVIAFAVDFADGTIYLPPGQGSNLENTDIKSMTAVYVGKDNLSQENIRKVILEKTGKDIGADESNVEVYKVNAIGEKLPVSQFN